MRQTNRAQLFRSAFLCTLVIALALHLSSAQTYTVLSNFDPTTGGPFDAQFSNTITQGRDGNLYFTTLHGGANLFSEGGIFQMTPDGTLTTLFSFGEATFDRPPVFPGGLTLGADGNFYGTTVLGGAGVATKFGTVFRVTPSGVITFLHSFSGQADGALPYTPPIQANNGNFYGTTSGYGSPNAGTIYELTPGGVFTSLFQFDISGSTGANPIAQLVQGTDGNLYGTTYGGGTLGGGVVFQISLTGQFRVLHNFDPAREGYGSVGALVQARDGNFYGGLSVTPDNTRGIYRISPAGKLRILHATADNGGSNIEAGLTLGSDGLLYGVAGVGGTSFNGTIFRLKSTGKEFLVLHDFDDTSGAMPLVRLVQHTNGVFFGDTVRGGPIRIEDCPPADFGCGVFYSLDAGLRPFAGLLSNFGPVGSTVGILGQGFTGTKKVSFSGTPSPCTVISDTYLTTTVPAGAHTGTVTVHRPSGPLKSNREFVVTQ